MPGVPPRWRCAAQALGLRRRWSIVHRGDSPLPRRIAHATKASIWATMGGAQRGRAGRVGAAACRVAGHVPSRDPALGCAGHYRASVCARPQAFARCNPLMARSADRGGAHVPCTRRLGATAGSQERRSTTASIRTWIVQELRAVAGDFTRDSAGLRPGPERAVVRGQSRARARATLPCPLGAVVWCPEAQHEAGWRRIHRSLHINPWLDCRFPHKFLARRRRHTRA
jgi:hypothetical protein